MGRKGAAVQWPVSKAGDELLNRGALVWRNFCRADGRANKTRASCGVGQSEPDVTAGKALSVAADRKENVGTAPRTFRACRCVTAESRIVVVVVEVCRKRKRGGVKLVS
jgi:hypothetical protein